MNIKEKKYRITLIVLIVILLILACNIMAIIHRGGIYFGRKRWFSKLSFSPDGKTIASKNYTSQVIFWNWKERKISHKITYKYKLYAAYDFSYSPNGKYFAISGLDGFRLYNTNNYELIYSYKGICTNLCFYPDGNLVAFIVVKPNMYDIKILNIEKNKFMSGVKFSRVLEDFFNLKFTFAQNNNYEPIIITFFHDGSSCHDESYLMNVSEILRWNDFLRKLKLHNTEHTKLLWGLLSKRSQNIITQWNGESIPDINEKYQLLIDLNKIINSKSKIVNSSVKWKSSLRRLNRKFIETTFSKEVVKEEDTIIEIWNINKSKYNEYLIIENKNINDIISRNSNVYMTYNYGIRRIGFPIVYYKPMTFEERAHRFTFSPDGKFLAYISSSRSKKQKINIANIEIGLRYPSIIFNEPLPIRSIAFSPDNRFLALGTIWERRNGEIRVYDIYSGKLVKILKTPLDLFNINFG